MAEDQEEDQELSEEEKSNLEASLEDTGGYDHSADPGLKGKIQNILSNKKHLMLFGGGVLILLLAIGVGIYTMTSKPEMAVPVKKKQVEDVEEEINEEEDLTGSVEKFNIYKLDPFFVPIIDKGKETGKFISLSANLLLSNSALNKEIDRVLPKVRKNIYRILRRKRPTDFTLHRSNIEQRIKKEIITASNSLLLTGTGTVTDVFFSSFIMALHHLGIENNLWNSITSCEDNSKNLSNNNLKDYLLNKEYVSCEDVAFKFLGISLAGFNLIISLILLILSFAGNKRFRH